jgi:hypothetical protein
LAELSEDQIRAAVIARINANGYEPDAVRVEQKAPHSFLAHVDFADEVSERQMIITRAEVEEHLETTA